LLVLTRDRIGPTKHALGSRPHFRLHRFSLAPKQGYLPTMRQTQSPCQTFH